MHPFLGYDLLYTKGPAKPNGRKAAVVGAGPSGLTIAIRQGARYVTVINRSDRISASEYESSYAKLEGVDFLMMKSPMEIRDDGIVLADNEIGEDGKVKPIPGTEMLYPCTGVIIAVSQGIEGNVLKSSEKIDTGRGGLVTVDEEGHTSHHGVFSAGDAASGARNVVEAVVNGKKVAEAMHRYMQSLPMPVFTDYPDVPVFHENAAEEQV